jgi:hypothetical protein
MAQHGWSNCPDPIRAQVKGLLEGCQSLLGDNLEAVYLHGSLAMDCFNPRRSNVDILVTTARALEAGQKRRLGSLLVNLSRQPVPLQVTFLPRAAFQPWQTPTPFDYMYSEEWRLPVESLLLEGGTLWEGDSNLDPLLAIPIVNVLRRGIVLFGPAAVNLLPFVPEEDFLAALFQQVMTDEYKNPATDRPADVILNSCRVYGYMRAYRIFSKEEAGVWALHGIPPRYHPLIQAALESYRQEPDDRSLDKTGLKELLIFFGADFNKHAQIQI